MEIPILVYHKIDPAFEWGITRVLPRQFDHQMRFLKENGYQAISLNRLLNETMDPSQKWIALHFDDAYQSVFQYAFPIMQRYGFTGTVFLISQYVGKKNGWDVNLGGRTFTHLNWNEIRQLVAAGWEMGSHTATHPDLTACKSAQLRAELNDSKKMIEDRIGTAVYTLAYPFGRFNWQVIRAVREAGYQAGMTMRFRRQPPGDHYRIPRQGVYLWDHAINFKAKLHPGIGNHFEALKQAGIAFCSGGTVLVKRISGKKDLQFM